MLKQIAGVLIAFQLVACSSSNTPAAPTADNTANTIVTQPAPVAPNLSWEIENKRNAADEPTSAVWLKLDNRKCQVIKPFMADIQVIEKENYKQYEIPAEAIIACGGWWAGAGDYYYVVAKGDQFDVMYATIDESEASRYQYKSIATLKSSDFK